MKRVDLPTFGRPTIPSRSMSLGPGVEVGSSPSRSPRRASVSTASAIGSRSSSRSRAPRPAKVGEHEVGEVLESSERHRTDADPQPGVVLSLQGAFDALEPVVTAGRARAAQAEASRAAARRRPPGSAGLGVGSKSVKRAERRQRGAAPVHVRLRLHHAEAGARSQVPSPSRDALGAAEARRAATAPPGGPPDETRRCAGSRCTPGRGCPAPRWRAGLSALAASARPRLALVVLAFGFRMSSGSALRGLLDHAPALPRSAAPRPVQTGVSGSLRIAAFSILMSRTKTEWPIVSAVTSSSIALGDVGRQHLDLELAERVVEHAAEIAHAVGNADEVDRHLAASPVSSARTS